MTTDPKMHREGRLREIHAQYSEERAAVEIAYSTAMAEIEETYQAALAAWCEEVQAKP
jgi:hypothetical protein